MRIKSKAGKLQFPFELLPNSSGVVTVVPRILHELSNLPRAPLPLPLPLRVGVTLSPWLEQWPMCYYLWLSNKLPQHSVGYTVNIYYLRESGSGIQRWLGRVLLAQGLSRGCPQDVSWGCGHRSPAEWLGLERLCPAGSRAGPLAGGPAPWSAAAGSSLLLQASC